MAIIKNCNVIGIERIEGTRKKDGKAFGFWQLHLTADEVKSDKGFGHRVLNCNMDDKSYQESCVTLGSSVMVYERGQYVDFVEVEG